MDRDESLIIWGGVILIVGLAVLLFFAALKDEKDWAAYREAHHCHVTGSISSSNGWGFGTKGEMVSTYIPGKTLWLCDGGEIIGRSN